MTQEELKEYLKEHLSLRVLNKWNNVVNGSEIHLQLLVDDDIIDSKLIMFDI